MTNDVTLLGTKGGPAIRPGSPMPTSSLVHLNGRIILVDAGLGVSRSVCDQGVPLTEIDTIFITHLHSDHYLELGPLVHTAWVSGRISPITIYGPSGLTTYWESFVSSMSYDIDLRIEDEGRMNLRDLVEFIILDPGSPIDLDGITVRSILNDHPPVDESFGLRFQTDDCAIVFSGDTAFMDEMITFCADADLLIHEAMLIAGVDEIVRRQPNGDERLREHILRSHTSASDVGRIATASEVKQLVLYHLVPNGLPNFGEDAWISAVRETWDGPLVIGSDGKKIEV